MTRPTDEIKTIKSFIVVEKAGEYSVKGTHFVPGYTKAHKATELEATQAAFDQVVANMRLESKALHKLSSLIQEHSTPESLADGTWASWNLPKPAATS